MFGLNLKFLVIASFLILNQNVNNSSSSSPCVNKKCAGDCDNPGCRVRKPPPPPSSSSSSSYGGLSFSESKPCSNQDCVGKCGRPQCQKNKEAIDLANKANKEEKCAVTSCRGECEQPGCKPKPCPKPAPKCPGPPPQPPSRPEPCSVKRCRGECNQPGCLQNKPENCPKPTAEPRCPASSEEDSSTTPPQSSTTEKPAPEEEPLSGSLNCKQILLTNENEPVGPIFTFTSEAKPTQQCTRCNLQTTPDNAAVLLTCYDCTNIKTNCGGDRKDTVSSCKNYFTPSPSASSSTCPESSPSTCKPAKPQWCKTGEYT